MEIVRRAGLALGATALTLLALEAGLRALTRPSRRSAGRVLGVELPPVRLVPPSPPRPPRRAARQPGRVRLDDLTGRVRDDALLGYAPREGETSTNGWWQSNNLGARARHDTPAAVTPGTTRVLVFGDSFASGSRVPQEAAWPAVLEAQRPGLEVVSLGVDGYSLAQSRLRYQALADRVAHHVVILTLSPGADLWRDVNTLRSLAGWRSYRIMPRFVLEEAGRLRLVRSPYDPPAAIYADNREGPSRRLLDHLRRYDRLYVPWMFEPPSTPLTRSVLARLVLAEWHRTIVRRRQEQALEPGSEGLTVSIAIAGAMGAEAARHGARFLLVLLPSERDLGRLRRRGGYRAQWRAIAATVARDGVACVDLADVMLAAPPDQIDRGFDGTHHGPRANALVAAAVADALDAPAALACGATGPGAPAAPPS